MLTLLDKDFWNFNDFNNNIKKEKKIFLTQEDENFFSTLLKDDKFDLNYLKELELHTNNKYVFLFLLSYLPEFYSIEKFSLAKILEICNYDSFYVACYLRNMPNDLFEKRLTKKNCLKVVGINAKFLSFFKDLSFFQELKLNANYIRSFNIKEFVSFKEDLKNRYNEKNEIENKIKKNLNLFLQSIPKKAKNHEFFRELINIEPDFIILNEVRQYIGKKDILQIVKNNEEIGWKYFKFIDSNFKKEFYKICFKSHNNLYVDKYLDKIFSHYDSDSIDHQAIIFILEAFDEIDRSKNIVTAGSNSALSYTYILSFLIRGGYKNLITVNSVFGFLKERDMLSFNGDNFFVTNTTYNDLKNNFLSRIDEKLKEKLLIDLINDTSIPIKRKINVLPSAYKKYFFINDNNKINQEVKIQFYEKLGIKDEYLSKIPTKIKNDKVRFLIENAKNNYLQERISSKESFFEFDNVFLDQEYLRDDVTNFYKNLGINFGRSPAFGFGSLNKRTEEYYRARFVYSLIRTGKFSPNDIGIEVKIEKGGSNSYPIWTDIMIFNNPNWEILNSTRSKNSIKRRDHLSKSMLMVIEGKAYPQNKNIIDNAILIQLGSAMESYIYTENNIITPVIGVYFDHNDEVIVLQKEPGRDIKNLFNRDGDLQKRVSFDKIPCKEMISRKE